MTAETITPEWSATEIIDHLQSLATPENIAKLAYYGIETDKALGIPNSVLRPLAKALKQDHARAATLWASGVREARLLAIFTENPSEITVEQARNWASEFNSWEVVDHAADLFIDAGLADELIGEFAKDEREFVRRTAFAMMAWGAVHLKKTPDEEILRWLPLIERHASDPRNFVKKAVNWGLRQIGKRSLECHGPALKLAASLAESGDKAERWVGSGAVKELSSEKILERLRAKANKTREKSR